jgi:hypothetical protein
VATEHAGINAACVHHAHMGGKIGEQRVEQIMRIAVAIEIDGDFARFESAGMGVLGFAQAIVDQAADRDVGLIEA